MVSLEISKFSKKMIFFLGVLNFFKPTSAQLSHSFRTGNERWTVNLVPARITRRAGASPRWNCNFFENFLNFRNFDQNFNFWKKLGPYRIFPWHYHFSILLALSKSSIHYLKQSCHSQDHFSMIFFSKTTFSWSCAPACAAPLWPA